MAVINPPERKLAKITSVHCGKEALYLDDDVIDAKMPIGLGYCSLRSSG